jgi:hypothetical protein
MPDQDVEDLKNMVTQLGRELQQMSLEFQESMKHVNDKVDTIKAALRQCQTRCHVENPPESPT